MTTYVRWLVCVWLCVLAGSAKAQVTAQAGLVLLERHLPANVAVERADCGQLAAAVQGAVRAEPKAAAAVVSMALSVPGKKGPRWLERTPRSFGCACVARIVQAAVASAPAQAADVLAAAVMLFPGCAQDLAAMLGRLEARPGDGDGDAADGGGAFGLGTNADFAGPPVFSGGAGGVVLPAATLPVVTADTNG